MYDSCTIGYNRSAIYCWRHCSSYSLRAALLRRTIRYSANWFRRKLYGMWHWQARVLDNNIIVRGVSVYSLLFTAILPGWSQVTDHPRSKDCYNTREIHITFLTTQALSLLRLSNSNALSSPDTFNGLSLQHQWWIPNELLSHTMGRTYRMFSQVNGDLYRYYLLVCLSFCQYRWSVQCLCHYLTLNCF